MFFRGAVKQQSELQKEIGSAAKFKKALINGLVVLPDGSKWRQIPNSPSNKLLWDGLRKNVVLFECVELKEVEVQE
jgi:hypothetical protein